ncbi:competence protein ComEC [Acidisoma sp. L85]|uniref:competence protein ComEC n=1 Tax=Acidisoma sp. L85 TaxID=1641850 RepID=UPI00131D4BD6|nr:competence protein ComEC [Acidisoma sp. L85]
MADFFEIDFLEVHTAKSGDAIGIRYEVGGSLCIHVVDGGYQATGEKLVAHINQFYDRPAFIDHVVVTHPDQDHAEGLQAVIESFAIGTLWMLLPWNYVDELLPRFSYSNPENLKRRLREAYPYLAELEKIANRRGIKICEPLQGVRIGEFTVLSPTRARYLNLVASSAKTPEETAHDNMLVRASQFVFDAARATTAFIRASWGLEVFPQDGTSNENEMSVVQFARLCNQTIVLTADTGRDGLTEAANYAPAVGLTLPGGVNRFQVPHHGGRHNVSTEILDRWFGERLLSPPASGLESFTAIVSAAEEDEQHPRKVVKRAFIHRGAKLISTDDGRGTTRTGHNAPARAGWSAAIPVAYPEDMEE